MFLYTSRVKRAIALTSIATFSVAVYQANHLREKYKHSIKLYPPTGPSSGSEKWVKKLTALRESWIDEKDDVIEKTSAMLREMKLKLSRSIDDTETKITEKISKSFKDFSGKSSILKSTRKVKLVLLGDSLVCGVGCDNDSGDDKSKSSPVLPEILAKILSFAMQADVEWSSYGYIGATVGDLRSITLPEAKKALLLSMCDTKESNNSRDNGSINTTIRKNEEVEIIVVVICGLNDWKLLIEQFPYGPGPAKYRQDLTDLIEDIEIMGSEMSAKCNVYLPAMPLVCGKGDPSYDLGMAPLTYFVEMVSFIWDLQKRSVALANERSTIFIAAPDNFSKNYATPGGGNFSSDGVHPSSQGYKWWAFHIAEEIISSKRREMALKKIV